MLIDCTGHPGLDPSPLRLSNVGRGRLFAALALLGALTLLCTSPAYAAAPPPDDKDALTSKEAKAAFLEGMKQYNLGHYPEALTFFERGYLKKPDPTFLFNLGQCYRMMHNPEQAARQYRAYLRASPEAPNRSVVEGLITEAEDEIRKKAIPTAPTETMPLAEPPTRAATTDEAATPIYKKWWLWTAVGAVVVGAGLGVGLGLGLSQQQTPTFPAVTF